MTGVFIARVLWLALPVLGGGVIHIAAIKADILPALARIPLDGAIWVRGRRLFGANKTLRGVLVMIAGTMFSALMQSLLMSRAEWANDLALLDAQRSAPLLWGALLGMGYVVGELPNSFVKRQLGVGPGEPAHGLLSPLFWVIDQVDSLVGALIFMRALWTPPLDVALTLIVITLAVHPALALVMVMLGLKRRVG